MRTFLIFILFCFCLTSKSQVVDTISDSTTHETKIEHKDLHSPDSADVKFFYANSELNYNYIYLDRSLDFFEIYQPLQNISNFYVNTGNIGSPTYSLTLPVFNNSNFLYKTDLLSIWKLNPDSIKIYTNKNAFSEVKYVLGSAQEQGASFTINTQIGNGIYAGLNLRYENIYGLYNQQRTYYPGGNIYLTFLPNNLRYGAIVTYLNDRSVIFENGGIIIPEQFTENIETNRKTILVNLNQAKNTNKYSNIRFQHFYRLKKQPSDSANFTSENKNHRIVHTLDYSSNKHNFSDKSLNLNFYPTNWIDSVPLFDTTTLRILKNNILFTNFSDNDTKPKFLEYSLGINHYYINIIKEKYSLNFQNFDTEIKLKSQIKEKVNINLLTKLHFGDLVKGNYSVNANVRYLFNKEDKIELYLQQSKLNPDYVFNFYNSDFISWQNNFSPINFSKFGLNVSFYGINVNYYHSLYKNYTYYNKDIKPEQYTDIINGNYIEISKNFAIKKFNLQLLSIVQSVTNDSIINLPLFMGKLRFSYENQLFKKALTFQTGFSATYHSKFTPDNYNPALMVYYKQSNFEAGNYPYIDFFLILGIKRAKIFAKYEHLNSHFFPKNYMIIPYYPMPDAGFKLGLSWLFFD